MLELLVPMIVAAILGAGYAAVYLLYSREKKEEGCGGADSGHGCAHCGACGHKFPKTPDRE